MVVLEGGGGLVESDVNPRKKSSQSKAGAQAGSRDKSSWGRVPNLF